MRWIAEMGPLYGWRITLTLLHVGWVGFLVAGLAAAGSRRLGSAGAAGRYRLNLVALLCLGASLPVTLEIVRRSSPGPVESAPRAVVAPALRPASVPGILSARVPSHEGAPTRAVEPEAAGASATASELPVKVATPPVDLRRTLRRLAPAIATAYAIGVAVMLGRLILAVCGGWRLRSSARPILDGPLAELAARRARRLGLRVVPALSYCERVAVPVVLGLVRPMILIPAALATGLTPAELEAVLTHELAHIRRHDHWLILVQRALEAVLFFHPAAWYLSRRVDRAREDCCDDLVVAAGGDRVVYAASLLRSAEIHLAGRSARLAAPALDGSRRSELRRRIARLLEISEEPVIRLGGPGVLALGLVAILAGGLGTALLSAEPKARPRDRQEAAELPKVDAPDRAGPQATFTARFIDGKGRPAPAEVEYPISGELDGKPWDSQFRRVPGRDDRLTAMVPIGLKSVRVEPFGDVIWWTWSPGAPRLNSAHIELKAVDGDRPDIVVQRLKSASLEIRLRAAAGELPERMDVGVYYPTRRGADGGPIPTRRLPGVYRLESGLLPGRPISIHVRGVGGFRSVMTRPFQFTEEGQRGYVELTLQPGVSTDAIPMSDAVPVVLKGIDGRPIPQPVITEGPFRSIACRAVDKDSGRPVADAAVTFGVEQRQDEDGKDDFDQVFSRETKTDADGRFTVLVPEKYLPDPSPKRWLDVRVTIRHPRYVTYWETANTREMVRKAASDDFPSFRAVKLLPARTLTGRLLDADGDPLPNVEAYKQYDDNVGDPASWIRDADTPRTDAEGRFRTNVPVGVALKLEFRTGESARTYYNVAADRADLGDVRVSRGVRIAGRVLDGDGKPVRWLSVTTPALPNSTTQPNFVYRTGEDGSFRSDELPPGHYEVRVGGTYRTEDGRDSPTEVKAAPGIYIPVPVTIRAGQTEVPELTIRPVESVRFTATLTTTRKARKGEEVGLMEIFAFVPSFAVRGKYRGVDWSSQVSLSAVDEAPRFSARVPKGLTDATLDFGPYPGRFRLDRDSPELFGTAVRLGTVEADRPDIRIRRHADSVVRIKVVGDGGKPPADVKVAAHYVREPEMRAAGVDFDGPHAQPVSADGGLRHIILPDEEVIITATAAGGWTGTARVVLPEGETREVTIRLTKGR